MKSFSEYIKEAYSFRLGGSQQKGFKVPYQHFPKDNVELRKLMKKLIKERGVEGDFNDIDTSKVTVMYNMFLGTNFNGNISDWDTSEVTDMYGMFNGAGSFNQDISKWDTTKVTDMECMFCDARSFDQDISKWNVSNVTNMSEIFYNCPIKEEYKPKFKK